MRSPTICPVSWPLPAISSASPGCRPAIAVRIASARSPISRAPFAAARIAARIACRIFAARIVVGDDDAVGIFGGDRAHQRPLAGIAVAAGAEHHHELALGVGPQRLQRLRQRVGLVGVIDKDRRAVAFADPFQPALGAFEMFERGEHLHPRRCRCRSRAPPTPAHSRSGIRRPAADAARAGGRACSSVSFCAKPSIAVSTRRMPSRAVAVAADRHDPQVARARRVDHRCRTVMIGGNHRDAIRRRPVRGTAAVLQRDNARRRDDNPCGRATGW